MASRRAVLLAFVLLAGVPARAESDAIKVRKDTFHLLSDQLRDMVKGLGDGVPVSAMRPRVDLAREVLARVPTLFPAGSDLGDTAALPVIWSDPAGFTVAYDGAAARMAELAAAAEQPDRAVFGAAVGRMAAACGTCHAAFRGK